VNPDAVVIGSGIWNDEWRKQTAASLGIEPNQIESHYKNRTMLKVDVRPMDVAGAIVFLANERQSSRTTGCVITVDGGNREGFLR
jgi:NAD(P)-dependent dehydrogenase (short-subunit alcohol dehydrogenase family)